MDVLSDQFLQKLTQKPADTDVFCVKSQGQRWADRLAKTIVCLCSIHAWAVSSPL